MEIKKEVVSAISASLENRRKDETFERALGKAIRRKRLPFTDYVEVIGMIRERARKDRTSLEEAAADLMSENTEEERDENQE